jgi:DHA1 family tetracycline resistance protein-like MFS transporter
LRADRVLAGLSLANFFAQLAHVVLPSTFVLYATYRYGWDTATVGATLALVGLCAMVVQGTAIGPIVKRFGERRTLLLGLACGAVGFFIFGASPSGLLFWIGIPVMALWGIAGAATQGADHTARRARSAGAAAGRDQQRAERLPADRTVSVHADIRALH